MTGAHATWDKACVAMEGQGGTPVGSGARTDIFQTARRMEMIGFFRLAAELPLCPQHLPNEE